MKISGERKTLRLGAAILALVLVAGIVNFLLPVKAEAHWGNAGSDACIYCHNNSNQKNYTDYLANAQLSTAAIFVGVDGVDETADDLTITVAEGTSFEIDWYYTNASGKDAGSPLIALPAGATGWTIAKGNTGTAPVAWGANWKSQWDIGHSSGTDSYFSFPNKPEFHAIQRVNSSWTGGNGTYADDGLAGDLDATAQAMGSDALVSVPVGAAAGSPYTMTIHGIGHEGNTKNHIMATLTINVTASGNNPPSVPTNPGQFENGGSPAIAIGGYSTTTTLVFDGDLSDPDGDTVKLQIDYTGDSISDCESALVASGSTNVQATCAGLTDGTGYDWQYRAVDSIGATSAWTAYNAATPDFTVDATAPTDGVLTPTPGNTQIQLDWTAATDVTSGLASPAYTVSMATGTVTPPADCTANIIYTGDLLTHTETGLINGTDYAFRVCATDNAGLTSTGATATAQPTAGNTTPNVPTNLAQYLIDGVTPIALSGYTTEASVVFEADISDPDGGDTVKLQIDTDSNGTFDCESALGANPSTNVQVTCALTDGAYDWQARTVDNVGAPSAWVPFNAATPDFTKDASGPVDGTLTATPGNTEIVLTWTAATDAHSGLASPAYTVSMATGTTTPPADCSANIIYTGDLLTHTETGLTNGVDYAFRVCADNNAGLTSTGATDTAQPAAGCTEADPTVTITTANQDITSDGGFVNYTVQVTNNDSAACGNTSFTLSAADTNSTNFYASTLASTSLTIAPGASAQTQVKVTARANQPNLVTNDTTVSTAAVSLKNAVTSAAVTTTINVAGGGCVPTGDYLNTNGDRFITSR